jgi:hypothetical protein
MPDPLQGRFDTTLEQKDADHFGVSALVLQSIIDAADAAAAAQGDATQALADAATAQGTATAAAAAASTADGKATQALADAAAAQADADAAQAAASAAQSDIDAHEPLAFPHTGTLAQLNDAISDANVPALAGQLGGTAASPDVRGVRETGGQLLTLGAIADGGFARRVGTVLEAISEADLRALISPQPYLLVAQTMIPSASALSIVNGHCRAVYLGYYPKGWVFNYAVLQQTATLGVTPGVGGGEVALASSAAPALGPSDTVDLTILAASAFEDLTVTPSAPKKNASPFALTLTQATHLWAVIRISFTTMPTFQNALSASSPQFVTIQSKSGSTAPGLVSLVGQTLTGWAATTTGFGAMVTP